MKALESHQYHGTKVEVSGQMSPKIMVEVRYAFHWGLVAEIGAQGTMMNGDI